VLLLLAGCTNPAVVPPPPRPMTPVLPTTGPVPPAAHFSTPTPTPPPTPKPIVLNGPLTVALMPGLPEEFAGPLLGALNGIEEVEAANGRFPVQLLDQPDNAQLRIEAAAWQSTDAPLVERVFAVVAPFATVTDDITLEALQLRWQGLEGAPLLADNATLRLLTPILGPGAAVTVEQGDLLAALEAQPGALGILPFDRLDPRYKVLTVDGVNVLDNRFRPADYPLITALHLRGQGAGLIAPLLADALTPATNRDPQALTTLIMTGVTAISRGTAAAIERNYLTYPATIISATLAAADITHISNEIPFLEDCEVNNSENNLVLCSHTSYMEILEAVGTDIVGLSGNHVNDFGRAGARESLAFYRDQQMPIYGSGMNIEEACAPLMWEDKGNTFAFIAALAFGPESAWATEEEPGACYYYDHKDEILAMVEELSQEVDIVAVELQYMEIYFASPTNQQVFEFRELRDAGADIVTGVQSHVPQAWEPYGPDDASGGRETGPGMISYGLGNLFFDQMWSWETRTEQMARHTIYGGRLLSTEILTAVLEDYAQPRWANPEERADILNRVFDAAPRGPNRLPFANN
jgi:poly-gamma-glutamate synthesis protein (capsule biosynthesis protein)